MAGKISSIICLTVSGKQKKRPAEQTVFAYDENGNGITLPTVMMHAFLPQAPPVFLGLAVQECVGCQP